VTTGKSEKIVVAGGGGGGTARELPLSGALSAIDDAGANVVRWMFPAYIFMILVGFFALRTPGVMPAGNDLNPDRAVFTSVNAATLTGFQLSMHPSIFSVGGKLMVLGLTVLGTLFTLVVGGMAVKRVLGLAWPDGRLVRVALVVEAFVLMLGAFSSGGGGAEKVLGGMVQTAAAWGNSGLYVESAPVQTEVYTHVVLLPLALLGGLGLVVILEVIDALVGRRPVSRHTQVVLRVTAALFLIGVAMGVLLQVMDLEALGWRRDGSETWGAGLRRLMPQIVTNASVTAINARTAGFAMLPAYAFPRAMAFFIVLLMMVGASPGGTGGGLKTTTLYVLLTTPGKLLRGEAVSRTAGIAAAWLGMYLGALVFVHMMLLWLEPQMPGDRVLFVTVSALSNVGLSHDVVTMTRGSLLLVSAAMFFGRITPLLVLWWMVDTTRGAEVAVG
jgi:trk system potassium uptake protein TrkH